MTAAGTDVAGLTVDEAAARLNEVHGARLENGLVTVQAADITWTFKTADAAVRFDELLSAKRALYAGRGAGGRPVDVPLAVTYAKERGREVRRPDRQAPGPARARRRSCGSRCARCASRTPGAGGTSTGGVLVKSIAAALTNPNANRVIKPKLISVKPKMTADKLRRSASTVITIEQKTFKLRLFKHLKVVKTYKVAVGQPQYPTPRGLFSITNKQVNPVWSVPNSPWAGELAGTTVTGPGNPLKARWMGITGSVGIHGTGDDGSIGTRASHGCIRMHVCERHRALQARAGRHARPHRLSAVSAPRRPAARPPRGRAAAEAHRVQQRLGLEQHLGVLRPRPRRASRSRRPTRSSRRTASRRACG